MLTINKIILIILLITNNCFAQNKEWTGTEKILLGTSTTALMMDWATTRDITRRYEEGYYEKNKLLGKHPSKTRVDIHFLIFIPLNYYIADNLNENRSAYLLAITASELYAVRRNKQLGLQITF